MFVDTFIRRPILATVCSLVIVLAGALAIPTMPIAWYPLVTPPTVSVAAVYTGANVLTQASSPFDYADGVWHHAAGVLNASGMYLYIDGTLAGSNTTVNSNTARLYAGPLYARVGGA